MFSVQRISGRHRTLNDGQVGIQMLLRDQFKFQFHVDKFVPVNFYLLNVCSTFNFSSKIIRKF